jgi:transposase-like protein
MDSGKTVNFVSKLLKSDPKTIKRIRQRYLLGGELALLQPEYQPHLDVEHKYEILQDIEKNGLSLSVASLKYDVSLYSLKRWMRAYLRFGKTGLARKGSSNAMKKKRQRTKAEMDELEMLRKRNEYLETENALLKKVKALVEEKEARLHAIGQKPSKD